MVIFARQWLNYFVAWYLALFELQRSRYISVLIIERGELTTDIIRYSTCFGGQIIWCTSSTLEKVRALQSPHLRFIHSAHITQGNILILYLKHRLHWVSCLALSSYFFFLVFKSSSLSQSKSFSGFNWIQLACTSNNFNFKVREVKLISASTGKLKLVHVARKRRGTDVAFKSARLIRLETSSYFWGVKQDILTERQMK